MWRTLYLLISFVLSLQIISNSKEPPLPQIKIKNLVTPIRFEKHSQGFSMAQFPSLISAETTREPAICLANESSWAQERTRKECLDQQESIIIREKPPQRVGLNECDSKTADLQNHKSGWPLILGSQVKTRPSSSSPAGNAEEQADCHSTPPPQYN